MVGHGAKFTHKVEQAIAALLSHRSIEDAARTLGVSTNTLLRWMKEPEFQAMYQEGRRLAFSQSIGRLQEASGAAVTTALKIMLDTNTPPGIRLRAVEIVLDQAAKAAELEQLALMRRERKPNPGSVTLVRTTLLLGPSEAQRAEDVQPTENDESVAP